MCKNCLNYFCKRLHRTSCRIFSIYLSNFQSVKNESTQVNIWIITERITRLKLETKGLIRIQLSKAINFLCTRAIMTKYTVKQRVLMSAWESVHVLIMFQPLGIMSLWFTFTFISQITSRIISRMILRIILGIT